TPSNLAISIMENSNVEVIAGVNLPMLVKLASVRSKVDLADAVSQARDAGQKYIMVASHVLRGAS
ncbi:MAG: PTS fructose transporter subunit IIA, partial [Alphaproteobacteria bacterium]|nr:PTS fructose transporter subunit IIA [Alphaproteobacteria bacterium]